MKLINLSIYIRLGMTFLFLLSSSLPTSIFARELKGKIQIGILQWAESPIVYTWTREGFIEGMKGYCWRTQGHWNHRILDIFREKYNRRFNENSC